MSNFISSQKILINFGEGEMRKFSIDEKQC